MELERLILNDDNDDYNNIPGTNVDSFFLENEVVEDTVVPNAPDTDANDKYIDNDIIIDDYDSLTSVIHPLQNIWKMKEWTRKMKEWTQKMKEWKITAE